MRFSNICATIVATLAACQGVAAQWTEGGNGWPATESESWSSTLTTYYSTRTVLRVVSTVYSTKANASSTTWTTHAGSASATFTPVVNGTTVLGTSASHSGASHTGSGTTSATPTASTGAATRYGMEFGLVAVAGLAGVLAL